MILANKTTWQMLRRSYLKAARACRDTLIGRGYKPNDTNVYDAVMFWVKRARRAHAIVMGREPIIDNFVAITSHGTYQGPLYSEGL